LGFLVQLLQALGWITLAVVGLVVAGLLLLMLLVLLLPGLAVAKFSDARLIRRLAEDLSSRAMLVSGTRWNWFDFITNNVIPALPDSAEVLWYGSRRSPIDMRRYPASAVEAMWRRRKVAPEWPPMGADESQLRAPRPYILESNGTELTVVPLFEVLHPMKLRSAKRDPAVIAEVRSILASANVQGLNV